MPVSCSVTGIFTAGNIITTSTNILNFANDATCSTYSSSSYVEGPVKKTGNDAFTFPTGKSGKCAPIGMSAPSNSSHAFQAEYFPSNSNGTYSHASKDISLDHISTCDYWTMDRTNGTSNVVVTLSWNSANWAAGNCAVTNLPQLAVARWDGGDWRDHNNGGTTGNTSAGTVNSDVAMTSFGPFALASKTSANPLPIELLSFDAELNGEQVDLNWVTSSEVNNDYFTIERSKNGIDFEPIQEVDGSGTSYVTNHYNTVDVQPYDGVSYYRLKQTDYDGKFTVSDIIPIEYHKTKIVDLNAYPNPVMQGSNVYVNAAGFEAGEEVLIIVRDLLGKEYYSKVVVTNDQGEFIEVFDVFNKLSKGTYLIIGSSNQKHYSKKLIIQ